MLNKVSREILIALMTVIAIISGIPSILRYIREFVGGDPFKFTLSILVVALGVFSVTSILIKIKGKK